MRGIGFLDINADIGCLFPTQTQQINEYGMSQSIGESNMAGCSLVREIL